MTGLTVGREQGRTGLGLAAGAAAVVGVGVAGVGWAALERGWFTLRRVEVPVLEPGEAPLRILHLSDLHLTPRRGRLVSWVRRLAALQPDLVVNTGDNFGALGALEAVLEACEPLTSFPGVFVFGSNDYFAPRPKNPALYLVPEDRRPVRDVPKVRLPAGQLAAAWRAAGWRDLNNARAGVELADGRRIDVVGLDDPHIERDVMPAPADVQGLLRVGVVHAPYAQALGALADDGARLVFAGHTHGGQLCVPVVGALVTNCDLDRRRVKGLSRWEPVGPAVPDAAAGPSVWLHVSAGLGTSPYAPVRFACRPEASLVTLVPRS